MSEDPWRSANLRSGTKLNQRNLPNNSCQTEHALSQVSISLWRTGIDGFRATRVPNQGKLAEHGVEQMCCHIADLPQGRDGLKIPFARSQRAQHIDQLPVYSAEQVSTQNGIEAAGLLHHGLSE